MRKPNMNLDALREIIRTRSNVEDVAKALGTHRSSLYRKLKGTHPFTFDEIERLPELLNLTSEEITRIWPARAPVSPPRLTEAYRDPLFTFDAMLNELEAMIHVLCDLREDHLSHGEPMREEQVELANTSLWGAELGLSCLHDHYRSLVDKAFKERRGEQ